MFLFSDFKNQLLYVSFNKTVKNTYNLDLKKQRFYPNPLSFYLFVLKFDFGEQKSLENYSRLYKFITLFIT